jgi:uncharacterized repeat protein (TIGR01451 family)
MRAYAVLQRAMIVLLCVALLANMPASQPAHAAGSRSVVPAGDDSSDRLNPATDAGDAGGCKGSQGNLLLSDQRSLSRVDRCDIGTLEMQPIEFSTKEADRSFVPPGGPLTYTVVLSNPAATIMADVRLTDALPAALTYVSGSLTAPSGSYGHHSGVITWTGSISASQAVTVVFGTRVNQTALVGTIVTNSAIISGGGEVVTRTASVLVKPYEVFMPCVALGFCPPFFDDFHNPESGWYVGEDAYARSEYLDGEYRVLTKKAGYLYLYPAPACDRLNYTVEVDARWPGRPGASYGLVFGISGDFEQYYFFDVNTEYPWFRLYRRGPGGFTAIITPVASPAIHMGNASNHIKVTRNGSSITLELNGTTLGTWSEGTITGPTGVGVMSMPYSNVPVSDARFDNFSFVGLSSAGASGTQNVAEEAARPGVASRSRYTKELQP